MAFHKKRKHDQRRQDSLCVRAANQFKHHRVSWCASIHPCRLTGAAAAGALACLKMHGRNETMRLPERMDEDDLTHAFAPCVT